jgi:hypothetical protein
MHSMLALLQFVHLESLSHFTFLRLQVMQDLGLSPFALVEMPVGDGLCTLFKSLWIVGERMLACFSLPVVAAALRTRSRSMFVNGFSAILS